MREAITSITYDDVLIEPKYSTIESRDEIDITSYFLGDDRVPIISAPMDTVSGAKMVSAMGNYGAYGILHRFGDLDALTSQALAATKLSNGSFGISVGVKYPGTTITWLNRVSKLGVPIHSICIDVAHGYHKLVGQMISTLREWATWNVPALYIIAGNVATYDGFAYLQESGADAIRVGIGGGSACTTRETTGVGVPQLSAILDCANAATEATLIADGGIQTPGDIAKALAAGADAVMLGRLLAGTDEAEGEYFGALRQYRGQSTVGTNGDRKAPEGITGFVDAQGSVVDKLDSLTNYLKSSFSYVGARNLAEFRAKANFVRVSPATYQENRTRL